jgi:hypothetical protein
MKDQIAELKKIAPKLKNPSSGVKQSSEIVGATEIRMVNLPVWFNDK